MAGISLGKIEALAPDQASLVAARKLTKPSGWSGLSSDSGVIWGECQGSGASPYLIIVSETDGGYKCTCPSRKFPCKHSLALMWMRAEGKGRVRAEMCQNNPEEWYRSRFESDPDYSSLLERLAITPAERTAALARYFDGSGEPDGGPSQPTKAHMAIAKMVSRGYPSTR